MGKGTVGLLGSNGVPRGSKFSAIMLCSFLAAGLIGALFGAKTRASNPIKSGQSYEFGRVAAGTEIDYTFVVINSSNQDDYIAGTNSSCSCTTVFAHNQRVRPNGNAEIRVTIRTAGKSGRIDQTLAVTWQSGRTDLLRISGFVVGGELAKLDFGSVKRNDNSVVRRFALTTPGGRKISSRRIEFDHRYLDVVQTRPSDESPEQFEVRLASDIPYGPFSLRIVIITNDSLVPEKTVSVSGDVDFPLIVEPSLVTLGQLANSEPKTATVRISSPYQAVLAIDRIETISGVPVQAQIEYLNESEANVHITLLMAPNDETKYIKSEVGIWAHVGGEETRSKVELYALRAPAASGP